MNDCERLAAAFHRGDLVRPVSEDWNAVDLTHALSRACSPTVDLVTPGARAMGELIGQPRHLVFVIVDGLGANYIERLPEDSFLKSHMAARIVTPFPSTTAVGITTFATGEWPARHTLASWFTYVPKLDDVAAILPFVRRRDGKSLRELGITSEEAFPFPSLCRGRSRNASTLVPDDLVRTEYTRYISCGQKIDGYPTGRFSDAVDSTIDRVRNAGEPTFTYVYTAEVDAAAHKKGAWHEKVARAIDSVDLGLARLLSGLPSTCRVVVTADHGHLDVPKDGEFFLEPESEICDALRSPPSGDARVMFFRVKPEGCADFEEGFRSRYGASFALLTTAEVEEMALLGPGPISAATRERIGDYTAISLGAEVIAFGRPEDGLPFVSAHSGLSPEEMLIPLVVAQPSPRH